MDNKKLFFGVSQKELDGKLRAQQEREELAKQRAEKEAAAAEQYEQNQRALEQQKQAYVKYAGSLPVSTLNKLKRVMGDSAATALGVLLLGSLWWGVFQSYDADVENGRLVTNDAYKPYRIALHDAFIPTSKYDYDCCTGTYSKNKDPKFQLIGAWCVNMVIMLCSLIISIRAARRVNDKCDTVDMMLDLEKFGKQYNLNKTKVKRLVSNAESVIKKMSASERVYFDMLMNGDINIKDQETMKNMAAHIIIGHLRSHPEDAEKILSVFDERTIPESVLAKIQQKVR